MADEQLNDDYATIRSHLAVLLGAKLTEITQHDEQFFRDNGIGFIDLMFDDGNVLRIWSIHGDEPFFVLNPESDTPEHFGRL